ncbi:hypothetical protein ACP70R_049426 [Stipagrostis hirtigluma subsp. patula]
MQQNSRLAMAPLSLLYTYRPVTKVQDEGSPLELGAERSQDPPPPPLASPPSKNLR